MNELREKLIEIVNRDVKLDNAESRVQEILSLISQREQASYEQGKREAYEEMKDKEAEEYYSTRALMNAISKGEIVIRHWEQEGDKIVRHKDKPYSRYLVINEDDIVLKAKYSSEQEGKHKIGEHGAVGLVTQNGSICAECHEPIEQEKLSYDETLKLVEKIEKIEQEGKEE